jgi:hypothetical protein
MRESQGQVVQRRVGAVPFLLSTAFYVEHNLNVLSMSSDNTSHTAAAHGSIPTYWMCIQYTEGDYICAAVDLTLHSIALPVRNSS